MLAKEYMRKGCPFLIPWYHGMNVNGNGSHFL